MTRVSVRFLGVVALQFLILTAVIGYNQFTTWTGETVRLRVEPVDPRDPFRGHYVNVQYAISVLDLRRIAGDEAFFFQGDDIYVELAPDADGLWQAVDAHHERRDVAGGHVLIRGEVRSLDFPAPAHVTYGIEQVFISEGGGPLIEEASRTPGRTVAVEVKVDRYGRPVARRVLVDGRPVR